MSLLLASVITDVWNDQLVYNNQQAIFLVLLGFLISFGFIRLSTRLMRSPRVPWWPGSVVSDGGLHIHHLVFGIAAMMISGAVGFALVGESPWFEVCAAVFGAGAGLTIDEFALWVYLDDVYWAEEGRSSIDAAVIAIVLMLLVMFGVRPFEIGSDSLGALVGSIFAELVIVVAVAICFAKSRFLHGIVGFFVLPLAVYGACRIGKPDSTFAKRRYGERHPDKQAKAAQRFRPDRRTERFKDAFRDKVGGVPDSVHDAAVAAQDATRDATRAAGDATRDATRAAQDATRDATSAAQAGAKRVADQVRDAGKRDDE